MEENTKNLDFCAHLFARGVHFFLIYVNKNSIFQLFVKQREKMLMRTSSSCCNWLQQAVIVAPVVTTSSMTRRW